MPTMNEQEKPPELLPCPFCGSKSVVWSEHFRRVRCNGCFIGTAPLGDFNYAPDVLAKLKTDSFTAWNTRADLVPADVWDEAIRIVNEVNAATSLHEANSTLKRRIIAALEAARDKALEQKGTKG